MFKRYFDKFIVDVIPSNKNIIISLIKFNKYLDSLMVQKAIVLNNGLHPKHRLMNYHKFFYDRIKKSDKVLDIGSGNGLLTYIVAKKTKANVLGIEINSSNYKYAISHYKLHNLKYIYGDILKELPDRKFTIIMMSNVLEHIKGRVDLIKTLNKKYSPKKWILRVPMWNRDWRVPFMDELGLDSRLDDTHFTEYTEELFRQEMKSAKLDIKELKIKWGEIWSLLEPAVGSS